MIKKSILFICTHNSARSQIDEAFLRSGYSDKYVAYSAGVKKSSVDPFAIQVMKEIGIDISEQRSKSIEEYKDMVFDIVVTVCNNAKETCPFFPGKKILHKSFDNPTDFDDFRRIRDELKEWITKNF